MADGKLEQSLEDVLKCIKHVILVLSGKGGVGKSTVTTQIAWALYDKGKKVGILDVDLCGPSIPRMMNVEGNDVHQCSAGWVPVYTDKDQRLAIMSIGFLLNSRDDAVVWRGPKKNAMIKQFLSDVCWGDLDYLIIDTPPGTSDEHITVVENLRKYNPDGAVLVTTPQGVSVSDVRREMSFCQKTKIPVLGVVENMSGFVCPHCSECTNVFSKGGGEALAKSCEVPFLGSIPLDPRLAQSLEDGQAFIDLFPNSPALEAVKNITSKLMGMESDASH
ncbi:cytosolic Fe-S cluster assembly factor NUBP2 homolog [Montipora foliosa]|uniref:cytosolic Fe-S cluster assembly factor NUBP2 homolog n=1 Tax=Montipora foliosa TaxID=591990 RepID=UPI0035F116FA